MLNGASLNKAAINAAAGVSLVLASASFTTAEAVSFSGEAIHQKAARANIDCSVQSIFGGTRTQYAFWNPVATAEIDPTNTVGFAGEGSWSAQIIGQFFSLNTVHAEVGFDTVTSLEALADDKLGEGDWSADGLFDGIPTKGGALEGGWDDLNSGWLLGEGLRSAGAWGEWKPTAELWIEPTVTSGGISENEAYVFWKPTATLESDRSLVATFINGAWAFGTGDWSAPARAVYGASGAWTHDADFAAEGRRTFFRTMDIAAGATLTIEPSLISKADQINLSHTSHFSGKALMKLVGAGDWLEGTETFIGEAWASVRGYGDWHITEGMTASGDRIAMTKIVMDAGGTMPPMVGKNTQNGSAWWQGVGSALVGGAALKLVPAPHTRVFVLPENKRAFKVPPRSRVYEVAA